MSGKKKNGNKKPYLKKSEIRLLIGIALAAVAIITGYIVISAIFDTSLDVKNGKVVTGEGDWIIVNERTVEKPKYYKYASYDFSPLDAEIKTVQHGADANVNGVYVYPANGAYDYGYVYGLSRSVDDLAESVYPQMKLLLASGVISDISDIDLNGRAAKYFWYAASSSDTDDEGSVITKHTQVFTCYMDTFRDGAIIIRIGFEPQSESDYVDEETGIAYISDIADCIALYNDK